MHKTKIQNFKDRKIRVFKMSFKLHKAMIFFFRKKKLANIFSRTLKIFINNFNEISRIVYQILEIKMRQKQKIKFS